MNRFQCRLDRPRDLESRIYSVLRIINTKKYERFPLVMNYKWTSVQLFFAFVLRRFRQTDETSKSAIALREFLQ